MERKQLILSNNMDRQPLQLPHEGTSGAMTRLSLLILFLACPLAGCAGPEPLRIDGSSVERFDESLDEMSNSLDEEQQLYLGAAILKIMFREVESPDDQAGLLEAAQVPPSAFREMLDGMTFEQIVEFSEQFQKPRWMKDEDT